MEWIIILSTLQHECANYKNGLYFPNSVLHYLDFLIVFFSWYYHMERHWLWTCQCLCFKIQDSLNYTMHLGESIFSNIISCKYNNVVSAFWSFCSRCHFVFNINFLLLYFVSRCLISFIKIELLKSWIVWFTYIFKINRKLNSAKMLDTTLMLSHDEKFFGWHWNVFLYTLRQKGSKWNFLSFI